MLTPQPNLACSGLNMTTARAELVDLRRTPLYHCISRCVRRAFLCGDDAYSGKNFDHRKQWLVDRMHFLAEVFAVDICAYAIMSNHFHLVVHVRAEEAAAWSESEILERYGRLFRLAKAQYEQTPAAQRRALLDRWRARLCDLSWMMRGLNEWIARRANREEGLRGRFWEGRFKSQPILDEAGLITCMSYVDLNPVRAGVARGLDDSEFTSIHERLRAAAGANAPSVSATKRSRLLPFADQTSDQDRAIPMYFADYVSLVDWTGRAIRADKPGHIRGQPPPILHRLNIDLDAWLRTMSRAGLGGHTMLAKAERLASEATRTGRSWIRGQRHAQRLYGLPQ